MNDYRCIGRFVATPQLSTISKNSGGETHVTKFTLAVSDKFKKNNSEELIKRVAYVPFEAYDSGAKVICDNYEKGDNIVIYALVKTYRDSVSGNDNIVFRVNHFEPVPYPKASIKDNAE
jgi:single-stranded DNA-binding protein